MKLKILFIAGLILATTSILAMDLAPAQSQQENEFSFSDNDFRSPRNLVKALENKIEYINFLATKTFFEPEKQSFYDQKTLKNNLIQVLQQALHERNLNLYDFVDTYNCTALHLAAHFGKAMVVVLLLGAVDNSLKLLMKQNIRGWTALHFSSCYGKLLVIKLLFTAADNDGMRALITQKSHDDMNALDWAILTGSCTNAPIKQNVINLLKNMQEALEAGDEVRIQALLKIVRDDFLPNQDDPLRKSGSSDDEIENIDS